MSSAQFERSLARCLRGDDEVDEYIAAGPFAHGHQFTPRALAINECKCDVCNHARRSLGLPCRGCGYERCENEHVFVMLMLKAGAWPYFSVPQTGDVLEALLQH